MKKDCNGYSKIDQLIQGVIKYKLLHVAYWIVVIISFLHYQGERFGGTLLSHLPMAVIIYSFQIALVYFLLYILVPRLLDKQKYFLFNLLTFAFVIFGSLLSTLTIEFYYYVVYQKALSSFFFVMISQFTDMIIVVLIFLSADIVYSRYRNERRNRQMEKARLETELSFLKAQLNPHFLFNALNSIYVLMKEDIRLSEEILLKFSSLLRYQLYYCNSNAMTLENEIEFLKNYIALEKVRKNDNLNVVFKTKEKISYFKISPFILIPFVENAFKHISHFNDRANYIEIAMDISSDIFHFSVENTYDENWQANNSNNGIGLQNVKRRLELIYPKKHSLLFTKKENIYSVTLQLQLNEN